jgi:IclR family KDG regulon transcriptional repressor
VESCSIQQNIQTKSNVMMSVTMESEKTAQSVDRALLVLEYLSCSNSPLSLAQISKALKINKASIYRTLNSLTANGYVYRDDLSGKFQLSFKICELSSRILERLDLKYIARSSLESLNRETGETVHMVIRDWSYGVYIDKIESTHAIRTRSTVGARTFLHSTATGKVLLASLPWSRVEEIIAGVGLPQRTPHTIVDAESLREELTQVARQGWAHDREENEEGINCIAAPLINYKRVVVAAVSITYPALVNYIDRVGELREAVCNTAREISNHFGYISDTSSNLW